jgi:hypothetical protein
MVSHPDGRGDLGHSLLPQITDLKVYVLAVYTVGK